VQRKSALKTIKSTDKAFTNKNHQMINTNKGIFEKYQQSFYRKNTGNFQTKINFQRSGAYKNNRR